MIAAARPLHGRLRRRPRAPGAEVRALGLSRAVVDDEFDTGEVLFRSSAVTVLVESLLRRAADADLREAHAAVTRLAATPPEPGFVLDEVHLLRLRALLARADGDAAAYVQLRDRYRAMATSLGFEGHIALAEAMP